MPRSIPEWQGRTDDSMPTDAVRLRIYARQNGLCACGCGRTMNLNRDVVHCDHRIPLADGGENRESNLQLMLAEHHAGKTAEENSQRAKGRRWQAKAFKAPKRKGRGFRKAEPQRSATRPLRNKIEAIDG